MSAAATPAVNRSDIIRPLAYEGHPPALVARMTGLPQPFVTSSMGRMRSRGEPIPRHREARPQLSKRSRIAIDPQAWSWVLREVAQKHGVFVGEITGPARCSKVYAARREAMRRMHFELGMTFTAIGRRVNRDRTCALHACRGDA